MLHALGLLLAAGAEDCKAFDQEVGRPVQISTELVTARQIANRVIEEPSVESINQSVAKLGLLSFEGYGIAIRSVDPRLAAVKVGPTQSFWHPCGYSIRGPSGWNAFDRGRERWTIGFARPAGHDIVPSGLTEAKTRGVVPLLPGWKLRASWPVYTPSGMIFVGTMQRKNMRQTRIVAFPDRRGSVPTITLADLRVDVQGFSITPGMHDSNSYLNLEERATDGALRRIVLVLSRDAANTVARQMMPKS
ncbi:MAG: hypothetical protein ABIO43_08730 [Sphingomicrobium sp.]